MKDFIRKVLVAVAPVFGALISIAILQAAHLPFPPTLSWEALPQWGVFAAVTYTCTALCMFIPGRVFRESKPAHSIGPQPTA
ncbi:MAG: hypothetical protein H7176_02785 [Bdellovibrionales bacterium]|nr:hypothetical protein [Massilia sp.]